MSPGKEKSCAADLARSVAVGGRQLLAQLGGQLLLAPGRSRRLRYLCASPSNSL